MALEERIDVVEKMISALGELIFDKDVLRKCVEAAVRTSRQDGIEEERESCAAIAKAVKERWEQAIESGIGFNKRVRHSRSLTAEEIEFRIRGRNPEWSAS